MLAEYEEIPAVWRARYDIVAFDPRGFGYSTAALDSLLDRCGMTPGCAFSAGTPAATHAKFDTLPHRLHARPVTVDGLSCDDLCAAVALPLSNVDGLADTAGRLQRLWTASAGGGSAAPWRPSRRSVASGRPAATPAPYTGQEQSNAVMCSDGAAPRDPRAYTAAAQRTLARSGLAGLAWVWPTEACARWPRTQDAYTSPWNRRTAGTILLVGNTFDPATPYASSVAMSHALARARLLTVAGYGHTEFSNPSRCAGDYEDRYLTTGALPPAGTVCAQDTAPFA